MVTDLNHPGRQCGRCSGCALRLLARHLLAAHPAADAGGDALTEAERATVEELESLRPDPRSDIGKVLGIVRRLAPPVAGKGGGQ